MIVPDVNLLVYAYDASSPFHAAAAAWWERCLSEEEPVGLPPVVAFGFVRVTTHARVFRHPMAVHEAAAHVRSWLAQPVVRLLDTPNDHVAQVLGLLERLGTAGNLVTDAQLAAVTMDHDAVLHTADSDFLRMPGLKWVNPLTGRGSGRSRRR